MNLFGRRAAALVAVAVAAVVATGRVEATTPTATPPPGAAIQRLDPAYQSVSLAQASFPVDLRVEGAANLGAFEVLLTFDSADVSFLSFSNGPFLGSTGRTALCLPPVVQLLPGTLRKLQIGCGTIGAPPPPGPTGNGLLATVWFAPLAPGLTDLSLEPSLSDPFGAAAFAVAYGAQVDIAPGPTPTFTLTPTPTNTATPCPPAGCPTPTPVLCAPTVVSAPASVPGSPAAAFDVPISVEHVCELGAFAFSVAFDPARLVFVSAAASGFLGSTGRTVQCVPVQSLPGDVRLSCVTLGAPPPQGASGTGVLAVLRFIGAQNGLAAIDVHDVSLLQPNAAVIPATETDGSADITPCGACPTVTPTQASTSTPTAAPTNTPTATPTATPCPGSCPSPTLPPAPATPTPTVPAGPAALRVAPAAITAPQGSVAAAAIVVDGATNLGAFSFVATWDPAHAALASVSPGAFLGSTGRPVFCSQTFAGLPPGAVRYSCGSLGATLSGPGGSGVLATLHLTVGAPGTMPLSLSNIAFTTPAAVPLPVGSISGGVITIISCGGPCPTATATPISSPTPVLTPSGVAFVSASPASFNVVPGDVFETAIMVANVSNLGAFDVTFEYNTPPGVTLALESWTPGPFLGSTGRPVFCQPPVLDNFDVRVGCATFGSAAAGPSGGGELGRLSFRALSFGIISSFGVQSAELGDPLAAGIAVQWPGPSTVIVSPAPSPTPEAGGGSGSMSAGGGGSATGASSNGARTSWGRGVPPLLLFALAFAAILVAMRMPRGLARTVRPAAALAAGAIALAALAGGGAESGVQLRPEPYAVNVVAGGDAVSVDQAITGTGNHDVASFELRYRFDPSVISVAFADGGYLGSGGRDVSCTTDTVTYFERLISCTTSGSGSGAFATGDGTLVQASIEVAVAVDAAQLSDGGLSAVHIQSLEILDSDGSPLFVEGTFDIGVQVHAFAGDADGDCAIDDADLQQVLASYGAYGGSPDYAAVLDAEPDGDVDVHDVQTVLGRLSATCGAPLPPPPPPPPLPVPAALTDFDGDGVLSGADDCPDIADSDQSDGDDDYLGDACEASHGTNGADADTDDDGCLDGIEVHRERFPPSVGGDRDPTSAWDFFDVTGDRAIDLADTLNVLSYFGDPGLSSTPGDLRDRDIFASAQPWQTDESDDGIDLADALVNLQSFGHNCSASP